jgi:sn-glycerol 3-phosphate transport system permease protein
MATDASGSPVQARGWRVAGWYAGLSALSLVVLFPVYMTVVRALSNPTAYVQADQPPWPVEPEWDVFSRAFTAGDLGRRFQVSALVTVAIVAAQLLTSILAAYAFAFLRFPAKRLLFALFMATLMLPIEVTLIPNVSTIRTLGWLDSYQGLVVPFLATALGTFLIRQAFLGLPRDLRDAAELDGYGHLRFLFRVAVPLTRPVVASFALLSFLAAWNQYTWPRAVTTSDDWETVQIGLKTVTAVNVDELNIGVAAAILVAVPILLLLVAFQRQLVRGLTAGAVK